MTTHSPRHLLTGADRPWPGPIRDRDASASDGAGVPVGDVRGARVVIVQRRLPHYRVPLFVELKSRLAAQGVELRLVHGQPTAEEETKRDSGHLDWAEFVPCRYAFDGRICWHDTGSRLQGADLVVVTPENRLLYNLWLQGFRRDLRLGLWGHGANFQGAHDGWRERFKRQMATQADWWFAYTEASLPHLARSGFPRERTTVLDNAIDTSALRGHLARLDPARVAALRAQWNLTDEPVGIYLGSLYAEKRIGFLLEAALAIRQRVPDFRLVVVGDGPDRPMIERFAAVHPWVHYAGLKFGAEKVEVMSLARVMLSPGMVGLGILDALIVGTPLVTTDCGIHSPEIAYLRHDVNGLMTPNSVDAYAAEASRLLTDEAMWARLRRGCEDAAPLYTIDRMASRFAEGIQRCLIGEPLRRGVPRGLHGARP